jgi:REP element-mobilizing transposase RayT
MITDAIDAAVHAYIGGIIRNMRSACLIANGTANHLHILARLHQDLCPSKVLREIKSSSSKWIHKELGLPEFAWQRGYGAFNVSESLVERNYSYIARQKEHHKTVSFEDEFVALLKANNIEYDEKYLWRD